MKKNSEVNFSLSGKKVTRTPILFRRASIFSRFVTRRSATRKFIPRKKATALDKLEKVVLADILGLVLIIGTELVKAVRFAAQNRILQKKVYLDEATGLPNKNKCEEILNAPDQIPAD